MFSHTMISLMSALVFATAAQAETITLRVLSQPSGSGCARTEHQKPEPTQSALMSLRNFPETEKVGHKQRKIVPVHRSHENQR